jgi:hypothetical protein|tara:strand:+ start:459 stop:782 length:324 start_codon:yes stop_codon:yes gene_type:complete
MNDTTIVNQIQLSTTEQIVPVGPDRLISHIMLANVDTSTAYHGIIYLVPRVRSSTNKIEHVFWYADVPAKSTSVLDLSQTPFRVPNGWSLEAVAEANTKLTLNLLGK